MNCLTCHGIGRIYDDFHPERDGDPCEDCEEEFPHHGRPHKGRKHTWKQGKKELKLDDRPEGRGWGPTYVEVHDGDPTIK